MVLYMYLYVFVRSKIVVCCNLLLELSWLIDDRSVRCGVGCQRENYYDLRVSGEEMLKCFGVVFGRGWKGQFSLSFGLGVWGFDLGIFNELFVVCCVSFGRDVEGVD